MVPVQYFQYIFYLSRICLLVRGPSLARFLAFCKTAPSPLPFLSLPSLLRLRTAQLKKIPNKSSRKEVATSISSAAKVDPEAPGAHPVDPPRGRGRGDPAPRAPKGLSVGSKRFYLGRVGSPVIDRASANQNSPFLLLPLPCQSGASVTDPPPPGFGNRTDPGGRRMLRDPSLEREEAAKENWHPKMEDSLER